MASNTETEIKQWLEKILKKEDLLENLSVKILGNSGKGDGYMGDIVFVEAKGTTNGLQKNYNLVLKCAKRSKQLREKSPVKEAFFNEIYFYDSIFPTFTQFQKQKGIKDPFDKVPKCYGTLVIGEMEVIALENLKKKGYVLWDRKTPLTRKHIDMVVEGYGKLHAVSMAMKEEEPETFQKLAEKQFNVMKKFSDMTNMGSMFETAIGEIYDLLEGELEESVREKWRLLKDDVDTFMTKTFDSMDGMKVITHGDCWNNNFMHYNTDAQPSNFVMIDWQLSYHTSPVLDLSYFLFCCLTKEDMDDLETILRHYHNSLSTHLNKLGSDPNKLYPFNQLLADWKKYCKYGVYLSCIIHKFSLSEEEEVPDMAKAAEKGEDVAQVFIQPIKDTEAYKKRMSYIVQYVVKNNLI